jgi:hypothetical protein
MTSSRKIEVDSFGLHATILVCPGTSHTAECLFFLTCDKLKPNIFDVHLVQKRLKKITELSRYSCMVKTCYTSREIIPLLRKKFPDRLISLQGQNYLPRSCDLTPYDFFL